MRDFVLIYICTIIKFAYFSRKILVEVKRQFFINVICICHNNIHSFRCAQGTKINKRVIKIANCSQYYSQVYRCTTEHGGVSVIALNCNPYNNMCRLLF